MRSNFGKRNFTDEKLTRNGRLDEEAIPKRGHCEKVEKNTKAMRKARISIEFQFYYDPYILEDYGTLISRRVI